MLKFQGKIYYKNFISILNIKNYRFHSIIVPSLFSFNGKRNNFLIDRKNNSNFRSTSKFDYNSVSEETLNNLLENLETKETELPATFDAEFSQGVLTIKFDSQIIYVLNKQPINQQIWLSSPFSGPKRFEWNFKNKSWCDVRNPSIELNEFIKKEFEEHLKFRL